MTIKAFPNIEEADEDGVLAVGGDLEVESLLLAYRSGIFPWPFDEDNLVWFAPPKRALLFFDDLYINRSFRKVIKKQEYTVKKNTAFAEVISTCASIPRSDQPGTWITAEMQAAYIKLHEAGHAHSIEIYQEEELIGGIYGVQIGKCFSAESMFHHLPNASKLALYHLVEDLRQQDCHWLDCQVQNPFLKSLGVTEVQRKEFMSLLVEAI